MSEDIEIEREILKIVRRKAPGTVAIFDCKGFYRCYEDDVKIITNEILMSNVGVQYEQIDENTITFHNLNNAQYIRVLRDLLLFLRFRVELYEECAAENENSSVRFILKAKGILGNLVDFEETLVECVEVSEMSTIGCVRLLDDNSHENKLVLVSTNSKDLRIVVAQLADTVNFTKLEQAIVSIQPRECIILNANMASNRFKKLEMALNRTNIEKRIVDEQDNDWMVDDYKSNVQKLLHKKFLDVQLPKIIWQTLHTLLSQINLLNDRQYEGAFFLTQYGTTGQMYDGREPNL